MMERLHQVSLYEGAGCYRRREARLLLTVTADEEGNARLGTECSGVVELNWVEIGGISGTRKVG